jgi:hypothetical protein
MFTIMRVAILARPKRTTIVIDKKHKDEQQKKDERDWKDDNLFNDP